MNPYPKYKPSGIEWIGEIPQHWELNKFNRISYLKGRIGWQGLKQSEFTMNKEEPYLITGVNFKDGKIRWEEVYHISEERFNEAPEIQLKQCDVLMTKDGTIGKILFVDSLLGKASLNSHLLVLRPKNDEYLPKYLYYQLQSLPFLHFIELNKTGTTFYGISQEAMGEYKMLLPPKSEQLAIATYLDEKTAQIDDLIAKKQKLIELLKEERTAVINEAVSGEGKNWERKKLKYVAKVQSSNVDKKTNEGETPILLCNYMDVYKSEFIDDTISFMEATASEKEIEKFILREGDVLITKDSETPDDIANSSFVTKDFENVICGYHLAQIRANKKELIGEFLFRLFQSKDFNTHFEVSAHGVTRYGLPLDSITDVFITLPPVAEQKEIAKHIFIESKRIDETVSKIEKEIELLQEYRTALISEVVTGKIKVV